jgi:hypothetical protein
VSAWAVVTPGIPNPKLKALDHAWAVMRLGANWPGLDAALGSGFVLRHSLDKPRANHLLLFCNHLLQSAS